MSPAELEAVGREPSRSTSISSSVLLEETTLNAISKEENQQMRQKSCQLRIMIDLQ